MKRLISLDILRGLTILGMIIVNSPGPGGAADMFIHCTWDGCRVADLVFPFFVFIVGASMFFSMQKSDYRLDIGVGLKIFKRSALIFLIGFGLNWLFAGGAIENVRIMAALQRIAIVYLVGSFAVLLLKKSFYITFLAVLLLLGYWLLVHLTGSYDLSDGNVIASIDASIVGADRMYRIDGVIFDPEGMVGNIAALASVLIGYLTAKFITQNGWAKSLALGVTLTVIGLLWSVWMPLNKPLWSSSFVLYTCGLATTIWAILHYLCDVKGVSRWGRVFTILGANAITCYVLSELIILLNVSFEFSLSAWLFANVYGAFLPGWLASLVWSFIVAGLTWLVAWFLYRSKVYIKL